MSFDRLIKRYSAYYSGWCVAFGEHEITYDEDKEINWLHGESKIGFALAQRLKRILLRELLGKHVDIPTITLADSYVKINERKYELMSERDMQEMEVLKDFCYPPGTKIITFSTKKPLLIMYKEIKPLRLAITDGNAD